MSTAPKDGTQILVRRHNDVFYEFRVVWWSDIEPEYPWRTDHTAWPEDRLDNWLPIPGPHS
jgi:hypothetical protein